MGMSFLILKDINFLYFLKVYEDILSVVMPFAILCVCVWLNPSHHKWTFFLKEILLWLEIQHSGKACCV
jgi:hypothetical protein